MKEANYNFDELIHDESFRRWVYGRASDQEKSYWDQWITKNPENRAMAIRAQQHIAGFSIEPSSQPAEGEAWSRVKDRMDRDKDYVGRSPKKSLRWGFRVAAVFLLAALTGLAITFITDNDGNEVQEDQIVRNEVVTDYGERKTINLSDGSQITLNAHSNMVYTVDPADSNAVEVFLDGEAHFSVAERKKSDDTPFRVRTSAGYVKVMGTKFVVSTWSRDTQVVLEEGEVALTPSSQTEETILRPGQLAEFNSESDTISPSFVNSEVYTSWTTYTLVFDKTPFKDVIARLENTYGVKVVVREPDLYEREISGSVDNTGLDVITSALSNTLDKPIEVTDGVVYIGSE